MLAINFSVPLHRDDYEYALIWGTYGKILNWSDIYQSLQLHYQMHGGRMVAFAVLETFLLLGKEWFNPFNAFLFVALIILIYWHSQRTLTFRFNPYILSLITLFCWLCFPQFGSVVFWMTGACVYLLTAVLIFAFLLPYHLAFWQKSPLPDNWLLAFLMFPIGVIAGWTVENTALTMLFTLAFFLWNAYRKKHLEKWMCSGFAGAILGIALLTGAPGNFVRYKEQSAKPFVHLTNIIAASGEMLLYLLPLLLFGLLLWRTLRKEYSSFPLPQAPNVSAFDRSDWINWLIALLILLSYNNGKFLSTGLWQFLIQFIAVPLGIATTHLKLQLANTLSGLEEMVLYLLVITQLYRQAARGMRLRKSDLKESASLHWRNLITRYPAAGGAAAALILAAVNNIVMVGSPRFPGRATFGSVVFCIIGVMTLLSIPEIKERFIGRQAKIRNALTISILLLSLPLTLLVFQNYKQLGQIDSERIRYLQQMVSQGHKQIEIRALPELNRALRHIYYVDWDNSVSKYGLCRYYNLQDITLIKD